MPFFFKVLDVLTYSEEHSFTRSEDMVSQQQIPEASSSQAALQIPASTETFLKKFFLAILNRVGVRYLSIVCTYFLIK